MSLAQKAGKAGALLFARKIWGALVNIGVTAYLARTLDKSDFGLVAISGTLLGFIQTIGLSGLGEYVVFYNGPDRDKVNNAAFWLNTFITVAIVLITLLVAPFWARLYEDPRIFNLLCLMLIGFTFSMFSSIPQAIFRKELNYQPMVLLQSIFGTLSQLSQVLFALLGFGVYSLALPAALVTPLLALSLFWRSGFRPNLRETGYGYWKKIFDYTKNVIGTRILGKFTNEGDTLLIGKLLGMEALGIYDIAFKLANLINGQLLPIITNISMPVFAKNQHDIPKVRKHYLKMIELISFVFFPTFAVLILFAPLLIPLLYGPKWNAAIVPFQILCLFAVFRTLSSPTSGLYNALGKPQIGLYFTAVFTPLFLATLYFSSAYGLVAACFAVMIVRQIGSGVLLYIGNSLLNTGIRDFFNSIKAPLISSLLSTIIILLFPGQFHNTWFDMFLFTLAYGLFMWLLFQNELSRGLQLMSQLNPIRIKSKE
ncbi:MAG: Teichuronic acid biosynthesis protein TuaB [Haliscomenobacter sp.]|nr:Teichuronic acid biosynthesis protein TuaB [Haliscomenobacter sp.]